ncbi:uncharacterized protein K489DRAFT_402820 [Dissoconium aciculare CBS 342.82]|uniref:RRM domain-containing protein n=1 Tax=Dissoconium aciculare CBS 342.82 TaxID=1314786 RepID=A0A6J3LZ02_9PEZI|nr:uncharacterized protein K489DRAFT_402820 [Dissoconium aciculare CBS 342.82]KAF1821005.1 hypothetical protein K489DRAFT_402820 [Dissoconium aciculare CBS 342.82]
MAAKKPQAVSLDTMLKEDRQKRGKKRELEELAEQIFKRSRTPAGRAAPTPGASLASRVGISKTLTDSKRPASLPRTSSAPARAPRPAAHLSRPLAREAPRPSTLYTSDVVGESVDDIQLDYGDVAPHGAAGSINIRGAASTGPHVVIAQNFAPGTTAADIESVMQDVGGDMTECRLIASNPTVIAEMHFVDKSAADNVVRTFNNKKVRLGAQNYIAVRLIPSQADGRVLHVYWKSQTAGPARANQRSRRSMPHAPEPERAFAAEEMELDDNVAAREENNRVREERRPAPARGPAELYQTAPRRDREFEENYPRGPARVNEKGHQANFRGNGYNREDGYSRGGGAGGRGQNRQEGRLYSEDQRRQQQGWR